MQEINYQILDKNSGLLFPELSDNRVRELAQKFNKSYSEMFLEDKGKFQESGVKHILPQEKESIVPILNESMSSCMPIEYVTYNEALKILEEAKDNFGNA